MFKSKLERFILKRVLICMILLSIFDITLFENRWLVFVGLIVGSILSIVKFGSNAWVFEGIFGTDENNGHKKLAPHSSVVVFAINQIILLPLLLLSYYISQWVFTGFIAGILVVPFVIMINSITEAFGITKNHFE